MLKQNRGKKMKLSELILKLRNFETTNDFEVVIPGAIGYNKINNVSYIGIKPNDIPHQSDYIGPNHSRIAILLHTLKEV